MRRTIHRAKRLKAKRRAVIAVLSLVLIGILLVQLDIGLRSLIESYGLQAARRSGMLAIHDGTAQVLSQSETAYGDLVKITRDASGRVVSAEADIAAINLLKSHATSEVIRRLQENGEQTVRIPIGNLIGGSFFVGRGPYVPFDIHSSGSVVTTLTDEFADAGINQTCHRLYLNMTLSMTVLLPEQRCHLELQTAFLICETVLVGEVPQAYGGLNLNGAATTAQTV